MNIQISGMGAITAFGHGVEALWAGLSRGQSALTPAPPPMPQGLYIGACPLQGPDRAFGLARRALDEAIAQANWPDLRGCALIVASTKGELEPLLAATRADDPDPRVATARLDALAARLACAYGIEGPTWAMSLACASSTAAINDAVALLRRAGARRALVVGVDALSDFIGLGFAALRALGQGPARPFDADRSGLSVAEGAGALALERASTGATAPLAYALGGAGRNDAHHITAPAQDGRGLRAAVAAALQEAQVEPASLALISAHGTATRFNDAMEGQALRDLCPHRPPVSAIKGAIGHTLGAAGVLEAILCARALAARRCPPSVGLQARDPAIDLDVIGAEGRDLHGEIALSTSSGFSGINAATLISAAPHPRQAAIRLTPVYLSRRVSLGGLDRAALEAQIAHLVARPERLDDLCVAGLAAAAALDPPRDAGLWVATGWGCLGGDVAFYQQLRARGLARVNPRLFAYTLPNVVLGEIAVALGMSGDNALISAGAASALIAIDEAAAAIRAGRLTSAVVLALDVSGAATPIVAAFTLAAPSVALIQGACLAIGAGQRAFDPSATGAPDPMEIAALLGGPARAQARCPSGYQAALALQAPGPIIAGRQARFPAAWPVFAGHFPGRPIVPGAELLAVAARVQGAPLRRVRRFAFKAPIGPDEIVTFSQDGPTLTLSVGGEIRAHGDVEWYEEPLR
ncbi:hypothetical protein KKB55_02265 [Myxococcota bacterium]|nr:hypothetical protein [Myxococcota bacterium]MBU1896578.1 hypothetical protein [Myxococcota bacterium]